MDSQTTALKKKKKAETEQSNTEKATTILKVTKKPLDHYNTCQSFGKAMNMLRSYIPASLARYRFSGKKIFPTKTKEKKEQFY